MAIILADSTIYRLSLGLIGFITLTIGILLITCVLLERSLRNGWRPTWNYWLLAHRLQNLLAVINIIEVTLLIISFPLVSIDRYQLCRTQLDDQGCHQLVKIGHPVLAVSSAFSAFVAFGTILQDYYYRRREGSELYRYSDALNNRPWGLFAAHFWLQVAAVATLTTSYSCLYFDQSSVLDALVLSIKTGTVAVLFFSLGCFHTVLGIKRYHDTMWTIRWQAKRRGQTQAARFNWLRNVTPQMKEELYFTIGLMHQDYWARREEQARGEELAMSG
ncbi:MAG: hypothetical protein Q9181_000990 [Wetmoreana brouardii]